MEMNKTKLIILISFIVAFAAGISVGLVIGRGGRPPRNRSPLGRELDLTPAQRDQMQKIWTETIEPMGRLQHEQMQKLQKEQEEAIQNLLSPEQREQFKKINEAHALSMKKLEQERKALFDEAMEKTKKILSKEQQKKYEELLRSGGPRRGRFPGPPSRRFGMGVREQDITSTH
jgi:Spy/CpxP family protein refolding chaperone